MQFPTKRGVVNVTNRSANHYDVTLQQAGEFIGLVTEDHDGSFIAAPGDHRDSKRHSNLRAAVLWIGEGR